MRCRLCQTDGGGDLAERHPVRRRQGQNAQDVAGTGDRLDA
ncbi:hypothetical protein ACFPM0_23925 [Pseudonocardia sulfidoxydans]